MKIFFTAITTTMLFLLPMSFAIAEDDSCELKDESKSSQADKNTNEFTRDKKWHLNADKILRESGAQKKNTTSDTSTSTSKTSKDAINI